MIEHEHVHEHSHGHSHVHGHVHDPEQTKKISNRLARAIGHLESIKKMVEDDRDCSEVLIQLAAVESAIRSTSRQILRNHMETCVTAAIQQNDEVWGDRIFEKCGIRRDEGGDGGKTLEIRGKRRLSARDGGANYQQS